MKVPIIACLGVIVSSATLLLGCQSPTVVRATASGANAKPEQVRRAALAAWERYLKDAFKLGQSQDEIEKAMAGKYRDRGIVHWGGSGTYSLVFLPDDYQQAEFSFDHLSKLNSPPQITGRSRWLRFPDGEIVGPEF